MIAAARDHLASLDPALVGDWLERAAIRVVLGGQREAEAMRSAYEETCRRVGAEPVAARQKIDIA